VGRAAGIAPLWRSPAEGLPLAWGYSVDYGRLIIEILVVESLIAAMYFTWERANNRKSAEKPTPTPADHDEALESV